MANFQVLCPNRMVGVGQRSHELSDEEAAKTAALWGTNPVHPTVAAYRCMVDQLETNILNKEACYTNPATPLGNTKMPRVYLSLERAGWVTGCSAAATRRDISAQQTSSGHGAGRGPHSRQGPGCLHRGSAPRLRGESSMGDIRPRRRPPRRLQQNRKWLPSPNRIREYPDMWENC
jgi:hypothetical protein